MASVPLLNEAITNLVIQQFASDEIDPSRPILQKALAAQQTLLQNALGWAFYHSAPPAATPGGQLIQGAISEALTATAMDMMESLLPADFGPMPNDVGGGFPGSVGGTGNPPACVALAQSANRLGMAKIELVEAIRQTEAINSDITIAATYLLIPGAFASIADGLEIGSSAAELEPASPQDEATGTLVTGSHAFFLASHASASVAGALSIQKLKDPYIDSLLYLADSETALAAARANFTGQLRLAGNDCPGFNSTMGEGGDFPAPADPGSPLSNATGAGMPPPPSSAEELPQFLTNIIMGQLGTDEVDLHGAMQQRAVLAQQSLLQNAFGSALNRVAPLPASTGGKLVEGAIEMALGDTLFTFLDFILPPAFGPLPGSGQQPDNRPPACEAVEQAHMALDEAKNEVVNAIRKVKQLGSDIAIAATYLCADPALNVAADGLNIASSITGIFSAPTVSPVGIISGSLVAAARGLFLMAHASEVTSGAVTIHKLKQPYMDALLKLGEAETAWGTAYTAFQNLACP